MLVALKEGKVGALLALGSAVENPNHTSALSGSAQIVALSTHHGPIPDAAAVVLPASSWAEADGTFVNRVGLYQESDRAIAPQGHSRPAFRWVQELAKRLGLGLTWNKAAELRALSQAPVSTSPSAPPPSAAPPGGE